MNKKIISSLLLTSFLTMGCVATHDDVGGLYSRQSRLEAKVDRMAKELNVVKSNNPGSVNSEDLNEQVFQLENKIFELEQVVSDMKDDINDLESSVSKIEDQPRTTSSTSSVTTSTTNPVTNTTSSKPDTSDYEKAHSELASGEYGAARKHFRSYISKNKNGNKVSEATFYIADSYFREKLYEDAILEYQTLIDRYPKDKNVPLAYLKQGYSLIEIQKVEEAKLFFESLIDKYPTSREADEARKKLRELDAA